MSVFIVHGLKCQINVGEPKDNKFGKTENSEF